MNVIKLSTLLFLIIFSFSCKIGNFMDIEDYDEKNKDLYIFALTDSSLIVYQTDTNSGSVYEKYNYSLSSTENYCKLLYENEKGNLYVSHGTNPYYLSGYHINGDGSLSILSGFPIDFAANAVDGIVFENNKSFFYAASLTSIYGYTYNSDGSLTPTAQVSLTDITSPLNSLVVYNNLIFKLDSNPWRGYSINSGTGEVLFQGEPAPPMNNTNIMNSIVNSYPYLYMISASVPNTIYSYSVSSDAATSTLNSSPTFGTVAASNINAFVKDPENLFLYFVSDTENMIFCFRTNTDGTVGAIINQFSTGSAPSAAAIDPYKQFFYTASTNGSTGYQINQYKVNNSLPDSPAGVITVGSKIFEMVAVRY